MILGQFAGGPSVRTDYNQTDSSKADYLVGRENIANHLANKNNPHGVTAEQVGAAPSSHVSDKSNPHAVTAAQVGAVKTSDLNGSGLGITNTRKFAKFADIPANTGFLHCYVEVNGSTPDPDCPYPTGVTMWWDILQIGHSTRQVQICSQAYSSRPGKGEVWHRSKHDSQWSAWTKLANARDVVPTTRKVNNKALSSDISLSAADVGARPSTWTPTAADVGAVPTSRTVNTKALSSNITLSASDVGAAPSGYGLGSATPPVLANANVVPKAQFFRTSNNTSNLSAATHNVGISMPYETSEVAQLLIRTTNGAMRVRRTQDGTTWSEEFINPVSTEGTEYKTTERWNGKVVYTKLVNLGKTVDFNDLSFSVPSITNLIRFVPNLDSKFCTNWDIYSGKDAGAQLSSDNAFYCFANKSTDKVSVYAICGSSRIGKTLYAQAWYTKD